MCRKRAPVHAFSLIELVIVVVIIAVIAAIAVPRISRGAAGAADSALKGDLRVLRDAIDMYLTDHDAFPVKDKAIDQLTQRTDATGAVGTTPGQHIYGPYLRAIPPCPVSPNVGASLIKYATDGKVFMGGGDVDKGWVYNEKTGEVYVNSDQIDESGVAYRDY